MRAPLRLAVLECDEPRGETKKRYRSFGNLFRQCLINGTVRLRSDGVLNPPEIHILAYDVVNSTTYPMPDGIDAVLLTGSRYDSFTSGENQWIDRLLAYVKMLLEDTRVRVLGICFGHQLIGKALGVMPERSEKGWEVSVTRTDLTSTGRMLFGQEALAIHQMHRDGLPRCPDGTSNIGSSPLCPVQGLYRKGSVFSLQGHPEFSAEIVDELLNLRRGVVLDDDVVEDGKKRAREPHDGEKIAAAFVKFMMGE